MTEPPRINESDELLQKATTMLSYCKTILGESSGPEHFVLVAAAMNTFSEMDAEQTARFLEENWSVLDEGARVLEEDIE
jgi:hypothetical protein